MSQKENKKTETPDIPTEDVDALRFLLHNVKGISAVSFDPIVPSEAE